MKAAMRSFLLLGLALLSSGCVTEALWKESNFCEPTRNPNLRLFNAAARQDVLVQYDEMRDSSDRIRPRAYYLFENQGARKPKFVKPATAALVEIPIFSHTNTHIPGTNQYPYALLVTNPVGFALVRPGQPATNHDLPVYPDQMEWTYRVLLTPLAVAADITIIGAVAAVLSGALNYIH
ncbi:MAG: hypothetical protein WCO56_29050 [Verrucomicrobiota bacterium]